ncbi:unnamed protein product [Prorocentrum cordatum]|uniref:Uncharacterized protein n=1 Tax=Prorocentrum cordatum TaxID=2364126 RepID=A0ABN9SDB2_9DINO|nr:unnamed protein product [Polarella glacialis]
MLAFGNPVSTQKSRIEFKHASTCSSRTWLRRSEAINLSWWLLCELGGHEIGLDGRNNLQCDTQVHLMEVATMTVNGALEQADSGAAEPAALRVALVPSAHPSYAAIE